MRLPFPAVVFAAGALASGCVFSFNNPVASQSAGTVTGTVQLNGGAPGQTVAGTRVDMLWSGLSIDLSAAGHFAFLGLPDGTYTLRYTIPPATTGGAPLVGELLDLYLPFTSGNVPDTIALGLISVSPPGTVEGDVALEDGGPAGGVVVGSFVAGGDGGPGEFEGYSTTTDPTGHYALALPAGNHSVWVSSATQSAELDVVNLESAEDRTGQDLALAEPALPGASLSGYVVLDPQGAHAAESVVKPILSDPFGVLLTPPCPGCQTSLTFGTPVPSQGITAAQITLNDLPAGVLYQMTCSLPNANQSIPAVVLQGIPAIAGQTTFLRQIFLLSQTTLQTNHALELETLLDAGVGNGTSSGGTTTGGSSSGGSSNGGSTSGGSPTGTSSGGSSSGTSQAGSSSGGSTPGGSSAGSTSGGTSTATASSSSGSSAPGSSSNGSSNGAVSGSGGPTSSGSGGTPASSGSGSSRGSSVSSTSGGSSSASSAGLPPGASCDADAACASQVCLGGVCCSGKCLTQGPCGAASCSQDTGACLYPQSQCGDAGCEEDVLTNAAFCSNGVCPPATTTACAPYACEADACETACQVEGDCAPGNYCGGNQQCLAQAPAGQPCGLGDACSSGLCLGNICCAETCLGEDAGVCAATCSPDGGTCAYPTAQCGDASCNPNTGVETPAAFCAKGSCPAPSPVSCTPYLCGTDACLTSCSANADCSPGFFCDVENTKTCLSNGSLAPGAACAESAACSGAGLCLGGFCCTESCVLADAGICGASQCEPEDGGTPGACAYPSSLCATGSCNTGESFLTDPSWCANGICPPQSTSSCNGYLCVSGACGSSCATDQNCAAGYYCDVNNTHTCLADGSLTAGAACPENVACASGDCLGGFCCTAACTTGECGASACASSDGADAGACLYPQPPTACVTGGDYACNGQGSCNTSCHQNGSDPTECATGHTCGPLNDAGVGTCHPS